MSASRRKQGDHRGAARELGHRGHQVHRVRRSRARARCSPRACTRSPTPATRCCCCSAGASRARQADDEHPFGYGRERYVYAFVVSIILFIGRRRLLALRGHRQAAAPARRSRCRGCRSSCSSIAIVLESSRCAPRSRSRTTFAASRAGSQFIRHAKAARAARRAARRRRRPHRPGVRARRRRPDRSSPATRSATPSAPSLIGVLLVAGRDRPRHRDQEPARRRGREPRATPTRIRDAINAAPEGRGAHPHEDALPRARTSCWSPPRSRSPTNEAGGCRRGDRRGRGRHPRGGSRRRG